MGRHRFDKKDAAKWGGPDLVVQDGRQSTTPSGAGGNTSSTRPAGDDGQGSAGAEPAVGGTA